MHTETGNPNDRARVMEHANAALTAEQKTYIELGQSLTFDGAVQAVLFSSTLASAFFQRFIELDLEDSANAGPGMLIMSSTPLEENATANAVHAFGPKGRIGAMYLRLGKQRQMQNCIAAHVAEKLQKRLQHLFDNEELTQDDIENEIDKIFDSNVSELMGMPTVGQMVEQQQPPEGFADHIPAPDLELLQKIAEADKTQTPEKN